MRNPFLIGEKVYLRPIEEADAERCYEWFSDPEVRVHILRRPYPNTARSSLDYFRSLDPARTQLFAIVSREAGAYIGNCGLHDIDPVNRHAELGIVIGDRAFLGKGFGREAVHLLCAHAFRTLNLHKVALHVSAPNERAIRAYTAVGFKPEGRLRDREFVDGRYVDTIVMGLLRGEFDFTHIPRAPGQPPPSVR
jgi:RimJ/RimL family protein N-acetyltransferase